MCDWPTTAFEIAFMIPVGFGLGIFVMALLGVNVPECVRYMLGGDMKEGD